MPDSLYLPVMGRINLSRPTTGRSVTVVSHSWGDYLLFIISVCCCSAVRLYVFDNVLVSKCQFFIVKVNRIASGYVAMQFLLFFH